MCEAHGVIPSRLHAAICGAPAPAVAGEILSLLPIHDTWPHEVLLHVPGEAEAWRLAPLYVLLTLVALAVLHEASASLGFKLHGRSGARCSQVAYVCSYFTTAVDLTIFVPVSYGLAKELGSGGAASGLIFSVYSMSNPLGQLLARSLTLSGDGRFARRLCSGFACLMALTVWYERFPLQQCSSSSGSSNWTRLLALRALGGCLSGVTTMPTMNIAFRSTPHSERTTLSLIAFIGICLGTASGPMFCATLLQIMGTEEASSLCLAAQHLTEFCACLWAAVALTQSLAIPDEFQEQLLAFGSGDKGEDVLQTTPLARRQWLFILGQVYNFERGFTVAAVEVASSMVLETQYGWTQQQIGYAVGGALASTVPVGLLVTFVRRVVFPNDYFLMQLLCLGTFVGSLLFFDYRPGSHITPSLLLVADFVIYSCNWQLSGLMNGLAMRAEIPNSWYSLETYNLMQNLVVALARALGFALSRMAVHKLGRNAYATIQLCMMLMGASTVLKACQLCRKAEAEKVD
mmetsp:Transcript_34276/g.87841  ORF Transcript_34276/g.87841 Transcript_34276/m.87841 type:complete len:517 (+) Transcript_34276:113-1663(+)|eukprot:CAMPEP_0195064818 /NCGR_PEP_ID=MMETSP0448-20130528/10686_1 /TAXON_ID=66468 /ORGANISM="Heterocapsa triquestra, Strain CCMP 448" /LENGTH=516 /DNA_ID=CAMNT_0040095859 /DNA_START=113 /DNA_END=1663 /DNA_ORIENTATION=-